MDTSMINLIETQMAMHLDTRQQKILHDTLVHCFAAQEIQKREDDNRHLVSVSVRKEIYSVLFTIITRIHGISFSLTVIGISDKLDVPNEEEEI